MSLPQNDIYGKTAILQCARATAATAAGIIGLPARAVIREIIVFNTTANAITGGLKFGTTSGATDVVAALAVGANALTKVTDALLLKYAFSLSASQNIFFDTVSSWNSASVEINILYYQL